MLVAFVCYGCTEDEPPTPTVVPPTPEQALNEASLRTLLTTEDVSPVFEWLALQSPTYSNHAELIGEAETSAGLLSYQELLWTGLGGSVFFQVREFNSRSAAMDDISAQKPNLIPGFDFEQRFSSSKDQTMQQVGELSFRASQAEARAVMFLKDDTVIHVGTLDLEIDSTSEFQLLVEFANTVNDRLD